MKHFVRGLSFTIFLSLGLLILTNTLSAQFRSNGPVTIYDQRDGRGNAAAFDVGTYRSDRNELGLLRNDSASSVLVSRGYTVRLCESEGRGTGSGKCEEFGEGNHNLRYGGTASYVQITRTGGGWDGGGGNGGSDRNSVLVFEDRDFRGRSQTFGVGRFLNAGNQLGSLRNDAASSVVVPRGYRVRLCENEGNSGRGEGRCEDYGEGRYNLRYDNAASYIEIIRDGGRWYNDNYGGGSNNPGNVRDRVSIFADRNQRGRREEFAVGTYRADRGEFGQLGNDEASSVVVPRGYHIRLCENAGGSVREGGGQCEEYGSGTFNLRYPRTASYIRITRD